MNKELVFINKNAYVLDENSNVIKEEAYTNNLVEKLKIENELELLNENLKNMELEKEEITNLKKPLNLLPIFIATPWIFNGIFLDNIFTANMNTIFGPLNRYIFFTTLEEIIITLPIGLPEYIKYVNISKKFENKEETLKEIDNKIDEIKLNIEKNKEKLVELENTKDITTYNYNDFDVLNLEDNTVTNSKVKSLKLERK